MMEMIEKTVQLTTIDCGNCGSVYAINERYRAGERATRRVLDVSVTSIQSGR